jgi:hypothetical protein
MKMIRNISICLAAMLLFVPWAHGQDLSKYRDFSLRTSLVELSKQVNANPVDARVIQQSPALIQELTWWPTQSYQPSASSESVQDILFSFYNGDLYKIVVTYQNFATQGLTAEDMVRAFSAKYGAATVPVAPKTSTTFEDYSNTKIAIAFWEDSQYSLTLSRSSLSNAFELVMFSKQVNGQADAAIANAIQQEREGAPQRQAAQVKREADELEALRQTNLKAFQP